MAVCRGMAARQSLMSLMSNVYLYPRVASLKLHISYVVGIYGGTAREAERALYHLDLRSCAAQGGVSGGARAEGMDDWAGSGAWREEGREGFAGICTYGPYY